jgi:hypothetical protein
MKKSTPALLSAALLFLFGSAAWATDLSIRPGKWQLTLTMDLEGQPPARPITAIKCEQAEDLPTPDSLLTKMQSSTKCQKADLKTTHEKASWTFACQNGSKGAGEILYVANGYDLTVHMSSAKKGGVTKLHIQGKRLGDC